MVQFFQKFGDKPCCITDLKIYLHLLSPDQHVQVPAPPAGPPAVTAPSVNLSFRAVHQPSEWRRPAGGAGRRGAGLPRGHQSSAETPVRLPAEPGAGPAPRPRPGREAATDRRAEGALPPRPQVWSVFTVYRTGTVCVCFTESSVSNREERAEDGAAVLWHVLSDGGARLHRPVGGDGWVRLLRPAPPPWTRLTAVCAQATRAWRGAVWASCRRGCPTAPPTRSSSSSSCSSTAGWAPSSPWWTCTPAWTPNTCSTTPSGRYRRTCGGRVARTPIRVDTQNKRAALF